MKQKTILSTILQLLAITALLQGSFGRSTRPPIQNNNNQVYCMSETVNVNGIVGTKGGACMSSFQWKGQQYTECTKEDWTTHWCFIGGTTWAECPYVSSDQCEKSQNKVTETPETPGTPETPEPKSSTKRVTIKATQIPQGVTQKTTELPQKVTQSSEGTTPIDSQPGQVKYCKSKTVNVNGAQGTTGGPCLRAFSYKNVVYTDCTNEDYEKHWCLISASNWAECVPEPCDDGTQSTTPRVKVTQPKSPVSTINVKVTDGITNRANNGVTDAPTRSTAIPKNPRSTNVRGLVDVTNAFNFVTRRVQPNTAPTERIPFEPATQQATNKPRPQEPSTPVYNRQTPIPTTETPTETPQPAQPTYTPRPAQPTYTPQPAQPTYTPQPAQPTYTPQPAQPNDDKYCRDRTTGGTAFGSPCAPLWVYNGTVYNGCALAGRDRPWCSTTENYEGVWGYCIEKTECKPFCPGYTQGGNSGGRPCTFPFTYKGNTYTSCTTADYVIPWCSTSRYYTGDYGLCAYDDSCGTP